MPISVDALRAMVVAGASAEVVVAAVEAQILADQRAINRRRKKDAERKQLSRMSAKSHGQAVTAADIADAPQDLAAELGYEPQPIALEDTAKNSNGSQKEIPPTPPKENNTTISSPSLFESEEVKGSGIARARSKRRATRLPDDWMPTLDDLHFARTLLSEDLAKIEVDKFRDHWHSARDGPTSLKNDWSAAWRNWCRKAVEIATNGGNNGRSWQSGGIYRLKAEFARRNGGQRDYSDHIGEGFAGAVRKADG